MESATGEGDYKAVAGFIREARELIVTLGRAAHGLWTQKPTIIDNRRQTLNISHLTTDELRNLARLAPARVANEADAIETEFREQKSLTAS